MNEGCEEKDSLVRVRAQVMTRDDSSGGWVPMDGGGLSNVSVRKRLLHSGIQQLTSSSAPPSPANTTSNVISSLNTSSTTTTNNNPAQPMSRCSSRASSTSGPGPPTLPVCHCNSLMQQQQQQHEYLILGRRISDQTVVLSCTIRKDFQYNKVMPTFHHWRTGDQKFGLTFQTAADARAFDKGVRMAVEDLLDGLADAPPALRHMNSDVSEDDVFMTLDLPIERNELQQQQSSPALSTGGSQQHRHNVAALSSASTTPPPPPKEPHLHRIHFVQRRPLPPSGSTNSLPLLNNTVIDGKDHTLTPEQLMWQQRDQELAITREKERAAKEKERQRRERTNNSIWPGGIGGPGSGLNDHIELDKESYSYVQFAREGIVGPGIGGGVLHSLHSLHEYSYPVMPDPATSSSKPTNNPSPGITTVAPLPRRDSLSSLKKNPMTQVVNCSTSSSSSVAPMLPNKPSGGRGGNNNGHKKKRRGSNSSSSSTKVSSISHVTSSNPKGSTGRLRCRHCQDSFRPEENGRGACAYAPDCVRSTIDTVSCIGCAQCLLYHCYADAEGDYVGPQSCGGCTTTTTPGGGTDEEESRRIHQPDHHHRRHGCCAVDSPKRWFALALLSLVVPCLWCYLPLRACYRCGVGCGCCGKPHEAA